MLETLHPTSVETRLYHINNHPVHLLLLDDEPWFIVREFLQLLELEQPSLAVGHTIDTYGGRTLNLRYLPRERRPTIDTSNPHRLVIGRYALFELVRHDLRWLSKSQKEKRREASLWALRRLREFYDPNEGATQALREETTAEESRWTTRLLAAITEYLRDLGLITR